MIGQPVEVLMVDDDPADVELTKESLDSGKLKVHLSVVADGIEAMDFLRKKNGFANAPRPDLIFLDLNMPKKDGREVLAELQEDKSLREIPVVVLTTSDAEQDILKSYGLGCNCYVTKPVGLAEFEKVVHSIEEFWLTIVKLPPQN